MERVTVEFGERSYDIVVEAGSLGNAGAFIRARLGEGPRKACIATTETVAGLYLGAVSKSLADSGFDVTEIVAPDGEEHKTLATYESIITALLEQRFERRSVMVPLGGGVIGDTAGFVAATLLRGIPFVQVPTTIVAQVDSSIGGKVAVNHPLGKNMIGSFYQPRGVLIDTRVLRTLEPREVVSGMGEAVKHAIIRDADFFAFIEEHLGAIMGLDAPDPVMERFIAWNCRIKAAVVAADEREAGLRAILNYGHTVGHALETVTGYTRFRHGEAVILGMIAAGHIAHGRGMLGAETLDRHNSLLVRTGLRNVTGDLDPAGILAAMKHDKKVTGGRIRFILPCEIGAVEIVDDVTEAEILSGIGAMLKLAGE